MAHLLMRGNTGSGVWADAAYRSEEMEAKQRTLHLKRQIHRKAKIGMKTLAYNMRRLVQLRRLNPCPA